MQIKRKTVLYLGISILLLVLLPLSTQELSPKLKSDSLILETSDGSGGNEPLLSSGIFNASQYNVSEYALYFSNKTGLRVGMENLTMGIPNNWDVVSLTLDVPSVFETLELFDEYNLNGDFIGTFEPWDTFTSYGYLGDEKLPYTSYEYLVTEERARASFNAGEEGFPSDFFGAANTSIIGYNKASSNLEIGELIEEEKSIAPVDRYGSEIDTEFLTDPLYEELIDPYGGYKGSSEVTAEWVAGIDALRNTIDAKWSLIYGYGSPSVAFGTPFYIPFEADSVSITYSWRIINKGYEANDAMVVVSTIDHQTVNGTIGINGEDYSSDTGGEPYLEYDYIEPGYIPDVSTHGYYERTFNITNLVGEYGYRKGWHYLDFGLGLFSPNEANDDVTIEWDLLRINATHYDWYKAAELHFDLLWEELHSFDEGSLALCLYFGEAVTGNLMRYFLAYTSELPIGTDWDLDYVPITIDIPHLYKNAFEVDNFYFYIVGENAGLIASPQESTKSAKGRITLDNFSLRANYNLGSPEILGLELRLNDGGGWMPVNATNVIDTYITDPEVKVEFNITGLSEPYIRFRAYSLAYKFSEMKAISSVIINAYSDINAFWNTTYNNTVSFNEAKAPLSNITFIAYGLQIENLPAFDGLGGNSKDWNITRVLTPSRIDVSSHLEKDSDNPYLQNVSVSFLVVGFDNTAFIGIWQIHAFQQNYMVRGTMYLDGGIASEKYYNSDLAEYQLRVRNSSGILGNYHIVMYNSTFNVSTNFPKYYSNINNQTYDWTVYDEGVGNYLLYSVWNDTDGNNQTKRLGWYRDSFTIWRHVSYSIAEGPDGVNVASGDLAVYHIQFNQISVGTTGVEHAYILAYNATSGNLWGVDVPPYTYLLNRLVDNGGGSYTISLKTISIPIGSYSINFTISKAYHDFIVTYATYLNVTGSASSMTITYISGAFEYTSNHVYLTSDNIPYVNDSTNSKIEFSLKDGITPLRDAYISASFIGVSESPLMIAIEKYSITFLVSDKGIYILTLNTSSLHVTTISNYTMRISFFKAGYYTEVHSVYVEVDAIPLVIIPEVINPQYERESILIQATSYLNKTGTLDACQAVSLQYSIENSLGQYKFGGNLNHIASNVFEATITMIDSHYLSPGNYSAIVNGTGTDLTTSYSEEIIFTIFPKFATLLNLTFPTEVRIGNYFSISTRLRYANLTAIPNQEIFLTINYSLAYSYQVVVETDSTGKAIYDLLIPEYYEGNNLVILAQYFGTEIINASQSSKSQEILGKIPVNIIFTQIPSHLQVGYNATWEARLSILYEQDYEGNILTMYGYYNFNGNLSEPFLIRELATDVNGTVWYTIEEIADGYENISIYLEFQGDISIEDQYNSTLESIEPKWNSNFELENFPSLLRLGQEIPIELTLNSSDLEFSETFAVMPIQIIFDYGIVKQDYLYYTDENGSLQYSITIPHSGVNTVNYSIYFPGTTRIEPYMISGVMSILPKLVTTLEMENFVFGQQRTGTFSYSAILEDELGAPVSNVTVYFRIYDENNALVDSLFTTSNNDGVAAISITFEQSGTYTIIAEFDGEGIYANAASQEITVEAVTDFMYFVRLLPYIGGAVGAVVAVGFIYQYAVVVPKRKKRLTSLKAIHQRFSDVENIQYILILTKAGLSVFSRSFTSVPIEETLISGFLSAISSFGAEIGTKMKPGVDGEKGLEELSYKQFKIIVNDAAIVRTALLLLKDASPSLKEKLKRFNLRFQEQYMDLLQNWTGEIPDEGPILEMVEHYLEVDLLYPHNINTAKLSEFWKTMDKKSINRKILEIGHKAPFRDVFYIREMMNHLREIGEEDIHIFNGIIELRDEKAIFPINPRTRTLIDQFKPIIDQLQVDSKIILLKIFDGVRSENQLRKTKEISDYNQAIASLMQMGLINNDLSITPTGEAVATILRLV